MNNLIPKTWVDLGRLTQIFVFEFSQSDIDLHKIAKATPFRTQITFNTCLPLIG